jgi:hypothetical protein
VAKQWCPLCIIVQFLLWIIFFTNVGFGLIELPIITLSNVLLVGCLYSIPLLVISILINQLAEAGKLENITQEINSIKATDEVFWTLLQKQPYYQVDRTTSKIVFGNVESSIMITILTNPHCEPCSKMHTRIEQLLNDSKDRFCIQYIFSSFNDELLESNRFLIATYLNSTMEATKQIYNEWFNSGKLKREEFYQQFNFDLQSPEVENELALHVGWKEAAKLSATPTVLVNGHNLPENYKIEDLRYL